ncbi:MAG: tetratricopeptide repeat protein [Rhodospirillales bacterium]
MSNSPPSDDVEARIETLLSEAVGLHSAGRIGLAEQIYQSILKLQRHHPVALHMLGVLSYQRGNHDKGIRFIRRALTVRPDFPDAINSLAGIYLHAGDAEQALSLLTETLALHEDFMAGLETQVRAQIRLRDYEAAAATYQRMDALKPGNQAILKDWAATLLTLGRYGEAEAMFGRALELNASDKDVRCYLAQAIKSHGRFAEALSILDDILSEHPEYVPALVHAGDAVQALGQPSDAIEHFRKAIALQPDHAEAHFNLGVSLLTVGEYREGWKEYAWRFRMSAYAAFKPPADAPLWEGEPLAGRSILIFAEQGLGDTIQFARYATLLKEQGATVHCQCSQSVAGLMATIDGISEVYTLTQVVPRVDFQISMMELPRLFDTDDETVPCRDGYVRASQNTFRPQRRPAVGLVWQGNVEHKNDAFRSAPLAGFDRLLSREDVAFYSLQYGQGVEQVAALGWQQRLVDISPQLAGFTNTADVVSGLDLVITVDTSMAHLAGALGVPVWVLASTTADWRWGRDTETTCWYSSMRLFRQRRLGVWDDVFAGLEKALADWVAGRAIEAKPTV